MFLETAIREDGGPDVDILIRKVTVQSGVPAEEIIDWTDESEYLTEVRDTARAVSESLDEEDSWFQNLTKRMKALDPEWTWMDGVTAHSGAVPGPPPEPQQAGSFSTNTQQAGSSSADADEAMRGIAAQSKSAPRKMSRKRCDHMAEDVYTSPCQNVFGDS